jgi:hypothetical protein
LENDRSRFRGVYWGFQARRTLYGTYNTAEAEKALLDRFYLARKRGTEVITDEFDLRKVDRDKLLLYAQKYPRPVKFELLESLVRTGAVLSNGKSPPRIDRAGIAAVVRIFSRKLSRHLFEEIFA